jgi:hypothetical protein
LLGGSPTQSCRFAATGIDPPSFFVACCPYVFSCTCFKRKDGTTDAENNVVPAWIGPDCSLRTCPYARAWVDIPFFNNTAHRNAECSNAGTCDRKSGNCVCYPGYEGRACDRST